MTGKRAFITGITGHDGGYLSEHLLLPGYEGDGIARRVALENTTQGIIHILFS